MVRELGAELAPGRFLIPRPPEPATDGGGVIEPLGRGRRLGHQLLVGLLQLVPVAVARKRLGDEPPRRLRLIVRRVRFDEGAQVGEPAPGVAALDTGPAEQILGVGGQRVRRILRPEGLQQRHRLLEPLEVGERAGQLEACRRCQRVVGPGLEEVAERLRRHLGPPQLQLAPGVTVESVGRQRRGGVSADDRVVGGAGLGEAPQPEERLGLPELGLQRAPRRGLEELSASKRVERRVRVARGEPRPAQQEHGVAEAPVLRIAFDEALEGPARQRGQAVGQRALADQPQAIGLVEGVRGRSQDHREEERSDRRDAPRATLHDDSNIVARYPTGTGASLRLRPRSHPGPLAPGSGGDGPRHARAAGGASRPAAAPRRALPRRRVDRALPPPGAGAGGHAVDDRARPRAPRARRGHARARRPRGPLPPPPSEPRRPGAREGHPGGGAPRPGPPAGVAGGAVAPTLGERLAVGLFDPRGPEPRSPGSRSPAAPLADRLRPRTLDEVVGQEHLLGPGHVLRSALERGELHSMILWGPPGSGKTTLASLMAQVTGARFVAFSAVLSGVKEIRQVIAEGEAERARRGGRTILFVDEIHRFNRAQQDAFPPHVEKGTIVLVGATTENPSFEVNAALLSRCRVYVLNGLAEDDLLGIMRRALSDRERGLGALRPEADDDALRLIARLANGDARVALNILEVAVTLASREGGRPRVTEGAIREAAQRRALLYDKAGEEHYNLISALHKSLRDSDPDGSLYWLGRMLESGEDPLYVARRLVRFASEDVGNADPLALRLTPHAKDAYHFLGSPEGELALAQATCYLALAPKSNAVYAAWNEVAQDIQDKPAEPVPLHLRNAPTGLMANQGYGKGYQYAHDAAEARVDQEHLPDALRGRVYYRPVDRGLEKELAARLQAWRKWRGRGGKGGGSPPRPRPAAPPPPAPAPAFPPSPPPRPPPPGG